jgi:hypothetical protein
VVVKSPTPQAKPHTVAQLRLADATVDAGVIRATGAADVQRLHEPSISSSRARAVLPGSLEPAHAYSDARSVTATAV